MKWPLTPQLSEIVHQLEIDFVSRGIVLPAQFRLISVKQMDEDNNLF